MQQWNDTANVHAERVGENAFEIAEKKEETKEKPDESSDNNNAITYIISSWNFQCSASESSSSSKKKKSLIG